MILNVNQALRKARSLAKRGDIDAATQLYTSIISQFPKNKLAIKGLAALSQAVSPVNQAASVPSQEQLKSLITLYQQGQLEQALEQGEALVSQFPNIPLIHNILGVVNAGLGKSEEAVASHIKAIQLKPDYVDAYSNLGIILRFLGKYEEAITSYSKAIQLSPDNADTHYNLGIALKELGRYEEAIASYTKAIQLNPDFIEAHNNLLYCLSEMEATLAMQLEHAQSFGAFITSRVKHQYSNWHHVHNPSKLIIGFVSADLKSHPVGYFLEGLLSHIDRSAFELVAYTNSPKEDELTARIKPLFSKWRSIVGKNDATVAQLMHSDALHILIDLSGHTRGNRLGVFAYKPAPVQVSWLGYWATTGVTEMDYKLGDNYMNPVEEEAYFSEHIWRLPDSFLCFTPPTESFPIASLPAIANSYITFGCFNQFSKMNDNVVAVWAEILNKVQGAHLFLKTKALGEEAIVKETLERFAAHGIEGSRIILEGASPRTEYFASYNRVDIALDPFPYTGGTTSAEALWMGIPVLTRKGISSPLSRQGESILHSAGMPDWIAVDDEDYISKAVAYSSDVNSLIQLRENLREQVVASPLLDTQRFAHGFEAAMKDMWQRYI